MSKRRRRYTQRLAARESDLLIPSPELWLPGREWPERSPFGRGLAESPYIGNPTCACPTEPPRCNLCDGWPEEWVVDLGVGGWVDDLLCDYCDQILGEFVATFADIVCTNIYNGGIVCTGFDSWIFAVTVDLDLLDRIRVIVQLAESGGNCKRRAVYESTTWDPDVNPDCFHLADGEGHIALTSTFDGSLNCGFGSGPCTSTLPSTIEIWDASP